MGSYRVRNIFFYKYLNPSESLLDYFPVSQNSGNY